MEQGISNLILIDRDMRRRATISHALSSANIHVEPFENLSELTSSWPRSGIILIHDDAGAIDELIERGGLYARLWQHQTGGFVCVD